MIQNNYSDWYSELLTRTTDINSFDCEDEDLNDFLINEAIDYSSSLLGATHLIKIGDNVVAYFCLFNDRITRNKEETATWNKINRAIANEKRKNSYPAIKIGRLAVSKQYKKLGFGNLMIRVVIDMYTRTYQQAGCRFITVDAYKNALPFYEKNGFKFLTDKDITNDTRAMYYDLKSYN